MEPVKQKTVNVSKVLNNDIADVFQIITDMSFKKSFLARNSIRVEFERGRSMTEEGAQFILFLNEIKVKVVKIIELRDEPDVKLIRKKTKDVLTGKSLVDSINLYRNAIDDSTLVTSQFKVDVLPSEAETKAEIEALQKSANEFFSLIKKTLKNEVMREVSAADSITVNKSLKNIFNWLVNPFNLVHLGLFDSVKRLVDIKNTRNYLVEWEEPAQKLFMRIQIVEDSPEEAEIKISYYKTNSKDKIRTDSAKIVRFTEVNSILVYEIYSHIRQNEVTLEEYAETTKRFMSALQSFFEEIKEEDFLALVEKNSFLNQARANDNIY